MFKGSYVALVTPMFENGEIDYASLKGLVDFHVANGTHGIVSVGTTGESATLPNNEHFDVVKKTVEFADKRIKVVAGSGANSTAEAIELSQEMSKFSIDGFLSVVPYYNKPQQGGMIQHFSAVADATELPVLLYNVPGRTVADMLPDAVKVLSEHEKIVGIKDATGDLSRFEAMKKLIPSEFLFLSGDDATGCDFLNLGGDGVISVTANVAPKHMSDMVTAALAGDKQLASDIDKKIANLHNLLFIEPNPVMPKWALYKMGLLKNAFLRLPMIEAELNSKNALEAALQEIDLLN